MRVKWGRILTGMVLITLGGILLLNTLGVTSINLGQILMTYWPIVLILLGLEALFNHYPDRTGLIIGSIIFLMGIIFLGRNLDWFYLDISWAWNLIWPLLLIIIGLKLLQQSKRNSINLAFMGLVEKKQNWELKSGSYIAFMGGVNLDLDGAAFAAEIIDLSLIAFMGGIEIKVPGDVVVICQGTAFLGGIHALGEESGGIYTRINKERGAVEPGLRVLRVSGVAIMGGIELKEV